MRIKKRKHQLLDKSKKDIESAKSLILHSFQGIWSNLDSTKIEKYQKSDFMILENGIVWNNDLIVGYLKGNVKNKKFRNTRD